MKKFILSIFLALALFVTPASAEFFPDIIVTSPNGIWTDSRAYETLNDAISAVGDNKRTIKIVSPQTVTDLTIPSNVTLDFERDGAIVNSGQLTINTRNIRAPDRQIFTGAGDVDFVDGSAVRSAWFPSLYKAINLTNDDSVTLLVTSQAHVTTTCALGNDVTLKWDSPNNIIQVDPGVVFSNIKNIEAGNYQIFAGLGDYDFLDGTELKLNWFHSLQSVLAQVEDEEVTIIVNEDSVIQSDVTAAANEGIKVVKGGRLNIDAGVTLTINGPFSAGLYQVFSGDGSVTFGWGHLDRSVPQWWGALGNGVHDDTSAIQKCLDTLRAYLPPGDYLITAGLTMDTADNAVFEGQGHLSRVVTASAITMITISKHGNIIRNMLFDGGSAANYGVYVGDDATRTTLDTVRIKYCKGTPGTGVANSGGAAYAMNINDCWIDDNIDGVNLIGQIQASVMTNTEVKANLHNQVIIGDGTQNIEGFSITDCSIEGDWEAGLAYSGLKVNGVIPLVLSGTNYFETTGHADSRDILIMGLYSVVKIDGMYGQGANAPGSDYSIEITAASTSLTISNSYFTGYNTNVVESWAGKAVNVFNSYMNGSAVNVGIGTPEPTSPFEVTGTASLRGHTFLDGRLVLRDEADTFTDGDNTPSVSTGNIFKTANTGATNITNFDDGTGGQFLLIVVLDNVTTFKQGGAGLIRLSGGVDWTPASGDTITFLLIGGGHGWLEISRSDNT